MITLYPYGGLCNRLRALASALTLTRETGEALRVFWHLHPECGAAFESLFEPLTDCELRNVPSLPFRWERRRPRNFHLPVLLRRLTGVRSIDDYAPRQGDFASLRADSRRHTYVSSCHALQPRRSFSPFRPVAEIQERTDALTAQFAPTTYGIHIRRGDHTYCYEHSPLSLFEDKIAEILTAEPEARFFLATDSEEVRSTLRERFGTHILFQEQGELSRESTEGMRVAVTDLFALARTRKIFGSAASTYSETAAEIGGIPLEVLRR